MAEELLAYVAVIAPEPPFAKKAHLLLGAGCFASNQRASARASAPVPPVRRGFSVPMTGSVVAKPMGQSFAMR